MAQFEIVFAESLDAGAKLHDVRLKLEGTSETLHQLSRNGQEGLENEIRKMAQWAKYAGDRAEDIGRAGGCLTTIAERYDDAERLVFDQFSETAHMGGAGMSADGSPPFVSAVTERANGKSSRASLAAYSPPPSTHTSLPR